MFKVQEVAQVPAVPHCPAELLVGRLRIGAGGMLCALGQVNRLHGGGVQCGNPGRRPQRGQQERRFAQVRPAALGPVRTVRACGTASSAVTNVAASAGRFPGSLAIPAVTSGRTGSGTGSSGTGTTMCWCSSRSAVSPVNGGRPVRHS